MAKYKDVSKFFEVIKESEPLLKLAAICDKNNEIYYTAFKVAKEIINQLPDVDAEPVVRCKNCYYWDKAKVNRKGFLICPVTGMDITPDDFCSYGERKEN